MSKSQKKQKNSAALKTLFVALVTLILVAIFIVVAILLAPRESIPEFEITDRQGSWEAQGTVGVFDDTISPGSKGEYYFVLKNDSQSTLSYGINLTEYLNNDEAHSFMHYRLLMNNEPVGDGNWYTAAEINYNYIYILSGTKQLMTLEWNWPYDNDNENDTLLGRTGGQLSVAFFVWAQVIYDE